MNSKPVETTTYTKEELGINNITNVPNPDNRPILAIAKAGKDIIDFYWSNNKSDAQIWCLERSGWTWK